MEALKAERRSLVAEVRNTYTSAFPGSAAWRPYGRAKKALRVFDEAHPEVVAATEADAAVARAAKAEADKAYRGTQEGNDAFWR